jgi:hypothetical protein
VPCHAAGVADTRAPPDGRSALQAAPGPASRARRRKEASQEQHPHTPTRGVLMIAAPSQDWNVFQQIFVEHWNGSKRVYPLASRPVAPGNLGSCLGASARRHTDARKPAPTPAALPGGVTRGAAGMPPITSLSLGRAPARVPALCERLWRAGPVLVCHQHLITQPLTDPSHRTLGLLYSLPVGHHALGGNVAG